MGTDNRLCRTVQESLLPTQMLYSNPIRFIDYVQEKHGKERTVGIFSLILSSHCKIKFIIITLSV